MGFEHRVIEQDGHRLHELADIESGYRIQVNNLGAELVSLARRADGGGWNGYLYRDGDVLPAQQGWQGHATVMGYFLHRGMQVIPPQETFARRFSMRLN
jgi:hypothetical protein